MAGIHSPSQFKIEDYRFLGVFYVGISDDIAAYYSADHRYLADKLVGLGFTDDLFDVVSETCTSCGTPFAHGAAYLHTPTNEVVSIGHICVGELWVHPDFDTKERHRKTRAAATRKMNRVLREAGDEYLAENFADQMGVMASVDAGELPKTRKLGYAYGVWDDMIRVARQYSSLTDKQLAFANKLLAEVEEHLEYVEKEAATAAPVPVTSERMRITGTVLAVKWQDSPFAYNAGAMKMLVRDDRGFKVWGTLPKSLDRYAPEGHYLGNAERGMTVSFEAKVEVSQDDETFGYFSRPTKASYPEAVSS